MIDMEKQQVKLNMNNYDETVSDTELKNTEERMREKWGVELAPGEELTDETASTLLSDMGRIARLASKYRKDQRKSDD